MAARAGGAGPVDEQFASRAVLAALAVVAAPLPFLDPVSLTCPLAYIHALQL